MHFNQATFSTAALDGAAILSITGEIDIGNKGQLELALHKGIALAPRTFVANLLEVTYVDSACLHALHHAHQTAERMNKSLALVIKKDGGLQKILRIAGLLQFFHVYHTVDSAVTGKIDGEPTSGSRAGKK